MGKKRIRGEPVHYDELKKVRSIRLTDTAWTNIKIAAKKKGLSMGEFMERWARLLGGG